MDMINGGRIMPSGGRTGHRHAVASLIDGDTVMRCPSQTIVDAITAATTVADLKAALLAWIAESA